MRLLIIFILVVSTAHTTTTQEKRSIQTSSGSHKVSEIVEGSGNLKDTVSHSISAVSPDQEIRGSGYGSDDEDTETDHVQGSGDVVEGSGSENHWEVSHIMTYTPVSSTTTTTPIPKVPPVRITPEPIVPEAEIPVTATIYHSKEQITEPTTIQSATRSTTLLTNTTQKITEAWPSTTTSVPSLISTTRRPILTAPPPTRPSGDENTPFHHMLKPGIFAAVVGGTVVGLLTAILLVMFIVYRMRKKDEGSYALEEPKARPYAGYAYTKASAKEFYA